MEEAGLPSSLLPLAKSETSSGHPVSKLLLLLAGAKGVLSLSSFFIESKISTISLTARTKSAPFPCRLTSRDFFFSSVNASRSA
jgi:hypothetical protein